jgi:hypothetical protein
VSEECAVEVFEDRRWFVIVNTPSFEILILGRFEKLPSGSGGSGSEERHDAHLGRGC